MKNAMKKGGISMIIMFLAVLGIIGIYALAACFEWEVRGMTYWDYTVWYITNHPISWAIEMGLVGFLCGFAPTFLEEEK